MDADLDRDKPICIAFDFNANINWLVAGQPDRNRLKVIKSFWVKYERKLEAWWMTSASITDTSDARK